uniref:Small ribosomal subunit protein uS3c n=1 Tax=Pteridomonas danica TaxID=38822 RepID=A0A7T1FUS2_9STRA|nr:ribosomal protein S3 [Pteridomonas danica]QPM99310.1 ribosomal protein S3 [Pteridomonas danica]
MGQKVNPLGFRLSTKKYNNKIWFKNFTEYSFFIKEETLIYKYLKEKNKILNINKIKFKRNTIKKILIIFIYSIFPFLIENKNYLKRLNTYLLKFLKTKTIILIKNIKVKSPFTKANLLANAIAQQIKNRVSFQRILQIFIIKKNLEKILGIKIQLAGRLNGAEKAKTEWYRKGRIPLQTLFANIEYSQQMVKTKYGIIGIKIWLFKKNL